MKGILPVLPTPFTGSGSIDTAAMPAVVDFALNAGASGVVYPGFASEVSELDRDERAELLQAVVNRVAGEVRIVAGASARSAAEVVEHGRYAISLGVRDLMVQPPVEIGGDLEGLLAFFGEIANGLPEARFILQNAPAPRGADLAPKTICAIARWFACISHVKEETLPSGPAISAMLTLRPPTLKGVIGGGGARYIVDEYQRGVQAANPALELVDLHVAFDNAWRVKRFAEAKQIYNSTLPLLMLQAIYRMRLTKHVLVRRGVLEHAGVRAQLPELDEIALAEIDSNLVDLGLYESPMVVAERAHG